MVANGRNGTLYLGSTVNLPKRAWEHRAGVADGFTKKYGCKRLVWFEAMAAGKSHGSVSCG